MTEYRAKLTFEIKLYCLNAHIDHFVDELEECFDCDADIMEHDGAYYSVRMTEYGTVYYYPSTSYYDPPEYDMDDFDTEDFVTEVALRIIENDELEAELISVSEEKLEEIY